MARGTLGMLYRSQLQPQPRSQSPMQVKLKCGHEATRAHLHGGHLVSGLLVEGVQAGTQLRQHLAGAQPFQVLQVHHTTKLEQHHLTSLAVPLRYLGGGGAGGVRSMLGEGVEG